MKYVYKVILFGFLLLFLLDVIGSIISTKFNFPYSYFLPLSLLIYILIPVLVTKQNGLKFGILSGALLGFFDSTIGWKISLFLRADTALVNESSNVVWIFIIIVNTIFASLVALLASWLVSVFIGREKSKTK